MRLLTVCHGCHRQLDASGLQPGSRFHCDCGEVVTVTVPQSHDAAVVRCSSCGAPREKEELACSHCSSDFTLHERDMHTICAGCAARISDKAKFCHHCGKAITTVRVATEEMTLECPACDDSPRMKSRRLGQLQLPAAECDRCAGLWLGAACFESLIAKVKENSLDFCDITQQRRKSPEVTSNTEASQQPGRKRWRYRHCPECQKMMQRRHYARRSGVIIDSCRDHGVWFDAEELHQVLQFIRHGGNPDSMRPEDRVVRTLQSTSTKRTVQVYDDEGDVVTGGILGMLANVLGAKERSSSPDAIEFTISRIFDL